MDTLPTFQNLPTYATPQAAPTSTLDLYCFDDLLVTCCKEIITNGFDSNHIPSTIKDWLSGKIMKALPQKLVQKLLSYILENRDLSDFISYKENSTGEEFTLYLYKSFAQRKRLEAQKKRAQTQLQPHQALDQFPPANGDTSATQSATQSLESKITNIFNEVTQKQQHDFNMETMDFYEEELIVEPKPASIKEALEKYNVLSENYLLESKKQASRSRDTSKYAMNEETLDRDFPTLDDDDIDTLKNSNKSVRLDLKAQRRKRKHDSGGNVTADDDSQDDGEFEADAQARTCKLCGKTYTRKTSLHRHLIAVHPKYWNANKDSFELKEEGLPRVKPSVNREKFKVMDELTFDDTSNTYSCNLCAKNFSSVSSAVRHAERSHRNVRNFDCKTCGKKFVSKKSYRYHVRMHAGINPFKCEYCGREFRAQDKYRAHLSSFHQDVWVGIKAKIELEKKHVHETSVYKRRFRKSWPDTIEENIYVGHRVEHKHWVEKFGALIGYGAGFNYGRGMNKNSVDGEDTGKWRKEFDGEIWPGAESNVSAGSEEEHMAGHWLPNKTTPHAYDKI